MKINILSVCAALVVTTTLFSTHAKSQNKTLSLPDLSQVDRNERVGVLWSAALENVRIKNEISPKEFAVFERFDINPIYLLKADAMAEAHKVNFDPTALASTEVKAEKGITILLEKFLDVEKTYPSSVDEYRIRFDSLANPCDSSGCTNMDFDQGTLNTWYGYYAVNNSTTTAVVISGAVGGLLGSVTEAGGNDPNVVAYESGSCGVTLSSDYQISITSSGYDAMVPTIPRVSPWASGGHSVMLGDSTLIGSGAAVLSKTFYVTNTTSALTYQYAVFLANPPHAATQQPFFKVVVLDENGDTITDCGHYNVVSGFSTGGFDSINSYSTCGESFKVYYRPWTIVNVPLKAYIGHCVTIEFEVADCEPGGHFGYAYIDCSCAPAGVISSSPAFCGEDSLLLTAPPGAQSYAWTGPTGGILSDTNQQSIWVQDSGTYTVVTVPVTGTACSDTITIHIPKLPGPPPIPSFRADTVCAGEPMQFINTSDSTDGVFSWDFYNIGVYNYLDTNNFNPTWTYVNPGKYVVKLNEVLHGCGANVFDTVVVDTNVSNPTFTATPTCLGDTTHFTPSAQGATLYTWNFGDPSSGINNTSNLKNPGHLFTSAGTYTVVLNANNQGGCGAIDSAQVVIYTVPTPVITGQDTICAPMSDVLSVTGGTTYVWNPGAHAGSTYTVTPSTITTYTVTATNGTCSNNATFTVYPFSSAVVTITPSRNPSCPDDTLTLRSTGVSGISYHWSTGSNATSIVVSPSNVTTYTLYETLGPCTDSTTITINMISKTSDTLTKSIDSVCPGTAVVLTATASGGTSPFTYSWSNGGTSSSITVNDTATSTYTAVVTGTCNNVVKTITNVVIPLPKPVISGNSWRCKFTHDTLSVTSSTNPTTYKWSNGSTKSTYITGSIDADSLIYVLAYNSLGCKDSIAFPITLRTAPLVSVTHSSGVCTGLPVELVANATGTGPYTYSWSTGQTTDSITVPSPADSTSATYTATVTNGCSTSKVVAITAEFPVLNAIPTQTVTLINDTLSPAYATLWANGNSDQYFWYDSLLVTCVNPNICDTVRVSPTVTTTYTVIGEDKAGCTVTGYVTVVVDIPCFNFKVPNVFTPNYPGPMGHDNVFYIKTENLDAWSITIFDRWGREMFTSTNRNSYWDGTDKGGSNAADGVYYYILTGVCGNNTYKKEGFVQLIR